MKRRASARRAVARALAAAALGSALGACREPEPPLVSRAELGVFWGGQVQQRQRIPFELDRTRQTVGFRLDFSRPLPRELGVAWEIERPGLGRSLDGGTARVTELGQARAPAGSTRFEQVVPLRPGDPLGSWAFRVSVEGEQVLERTLDVYDPRARPALSSSARP